MASNPSKPLPKDALVMQCILKEAGVTEYEPRIVNLMLDVAYKHVTNILEEAKAYSNHAKKKTVDAEDVKLAIQMKASQTFTAPPPRDVLMEIARARNSIPLPTIKPLCGLNLPPDRYCVTACNYVLKNKPKQTQAAKSSMNPRMSMLSNKSGGVKTGSPISFSSGGQTLTVVGKQGINKTQPPKPIIKFSTGPPSGSTLQPRMLATVPVTTSITTMSDSVKLEYKPQQQQQQQQVGGVKRKLETEYMDIDNM